MCGFLFSTQLSVLIVFKKIFNGSSLLFFFGGISICIFFSFLRGNSKKTTNLPYR